MKEINYIFLIIAIDVLFLLYGVHTLSINYYEAQIFFNEKGLIHNLINLSCKIFGQNDYALRVPFIVIHVLSTILIYLVGKPHLKRKIDRVSSVLIFVLLPGTISAALLVNGASFIIFFTLLFLFFYQKEKKYAAYIVLCVALFVDAGFVILYFLLFFYAIAKRDNILLIVSLFLFTVSLYFFGYEVSGKPKNFFLDTFGVYAAIFSPFVFLYFIYTQYRILIKKKKTLLWWISFGAFMCSILLSFRQRIPIEDFAPYLIISTPLLVRTFFSSYRVRLPDNRRVHKIFLSFVVVSLIFSTFLALFNQTIYSFFENPKKHFAYTYHVAKELSDELKKNKETALYVEDSRLALRLKFYGIDSGHEERLIEDENGDIVIKYFNKDIAKYKVISF